MILSATIVLFKNNKDTVRKTVACFLKLQIDKKLFLVDNSPTDILKKEFENPEIEYLFIGKNLGFGAGHNKVLDRIRNNSSFHLVLNPDVTFLPEVIPNIIDELIKDQKVAMIAPKVKYPSGDDQFSCRRFPSFFDLLVRRLGIFKVFFSSKIKRGEYGDVDLNVPLNVEYVSGCFQLFKTADFVDLNGFDERYFMYMEDIDICRKIANMNKTILYYPYELIFHDHDQGSSKNIKLFFYHISSIFKYFYKWNLGIKNYK